VFFEDWQRKSGNSSQIEYAAFAVVFLPGGPPFAFPSLPDWAPSAEAARDLAADRARVEGIVPLLFLSPRQGPTPLPSSPLSLDRHRDWLGLPQAFSQFNIRDGELFISHVAGLLDATEVLWNTSTANVEGRQFYGYAMAICTNKRTYGFFADKVFSTAEDAIKAGVLNVVAGLNQLLASEGLEVRNLESNPSIVHHQDLDLSVVVDGMEGDDFTGNVVARFYFGEDLEDNNVTSPSTAINPASVTTTSSFPHQSASRLRSLSQASVEQAIRWAALAERYKYRERPKMVDDDRKHGRKFAKRR